MLPADTNLTIDNTPKTIIIQEYDESKTAEENGVKEKSQ